MLRSGGERDYNELGTLYEHPEISPRIWNSHGFTVCKEMDLHTISKPKVEELAKRTIDPQAIPCIIPIQGNEGLNSAMWIELSSTLKMNELKLLIDDLQIQQTKEYIKLIDEKEKALMRLPYLQTFYLIREAVNLKVTYKGGDIKLTEPASGYKDRIVALSYGNYIASKIINKCEKLRAEGSEINWDDIQLVF